MKKTILVSLAGLALFLAGCIQQTPNLNQNVNQLVANIDQNTNQNLNITLLKNLTYLISKEDTSKYCNGEDMNSDGYKKTITTEITTNISIDTMTKSELAKAIIVAATTGQCQNVLKQTDLRVEGDTVYIAPIDAWAGISIIMCSCRPQIEVNLLRIPGIEKVVYEKSIQPTADINQNINPLLKITTPSQDGCAYVYDDVSYREILQYQKREVIRRSQLLNNLPAEVNNELKPFLNQQFLVTQVCKVSDVVFAYNLVNENQKNGHVTFIVASFKWNGKQLNSYIEYPDSYVENPPPVGPNFGCTIEQVTLDYIDYSCGWGDGPAGESKIYRLNFDGKPAILLKDCQTIDSDSTCK